MNQFRFALESIIGTALDIVELMGIDDAQDPQNTDVQNNKHKLGALLAELLNKEGISKSVQDNILDGMCICCVAIWVFVWLVIVLICV